MTLIELVPPLAVCQQLKEKGFPQDTALAWQRSTIDKGHPASVHVVGDNSALCIEDFFEDVCAAPTAEEILRVLPVLIDIRGSCASLQSWVSAMNDFPFYVGWQTHHLPTEIEGPWYGGNGLSESAAQAYLWWKAPPKEREA